MTSPDGEEDEDFNEVLTGVSLALDALRARNHAEAERILTAILDEHAEPEEA